MENIVQGQWLRGPSADLGDTIDQSLRFRASNQSLSHTPSSSSSRTTWTWSGWLKKSKNASGTDLDIFGAAPSSHASDPAISYMYFRSNDEIAFFNYWSSAVQSDLRTTAQFRDISAWYHIVLAVDTTIASPSSDRIKLYINGVQITDFATATYPAQNLQLWINHNVEHKIGEEPVRDRYDFDGYMADVYFVDGTQLAATDFGKFNTDGVWVPQNYTGSYGTNGFHLTFDSSQTNGIGHDSSGNGNNFTASGFDTATISSSNFDNDIDYEDTPTNNHPTLNPLTKSETGSLTAGTPVWSAGNLEFRGHNTDDTGTHRVRSTMATMGVTSGKWYFEVTRPHITSGVTPNNSWIVGWATSAPPHRSPFSGSGWTEIENYAVFDGFNGATKANGATVQSPQSTPSEATDQILAYAFDFDATSNNVKLYHNNTLINTMSLDIGDSVMLPCVWSGYGSRNAVNYGQRPFVYTPPSGHVGLESNLLPEPTIKNAKDHFEAITFTNNTSGNTITGLNFQPDFVWIKVRNQSYSHRLHDSIRGVQNYLMSNSDAAEQLSQSDSLLSFTSDGFTTGDQGQANGDTNVAWCWKAGGTAVSNTAGDITSSVSANTDAGFSIVSYTANGSSSDQTVGHGLTATPEMVFLKNRDDPKVWRVTCTGLAQGEDLKLEQNIAKASVSNGTVDLTTSTSSLLNLKVGSGSTPQKNINEGTDDYILYCWHSVEAYSKIGTWTGTGSSDGPFVYCGFKPQFLLFKNINTSGYWQIRDSARDTVNPVGNELYPSTSESENTHSSTRYIDFLSNGFKIRTDNSPVNNNTNTIVFMAFAENPFGGENQPPATAR